MRIKSTHPESQGPFVDIDDDQFDETKHEVYVEDGALVKEPIVPPAPASTDSTPEVEPKTPEDETPTPEVEDAPVIPQPWAKPTVNTN